MPTDVVEIENELRSVLQEKHRIQEHIHAIDQDMSVAETWLRMDNPDTEKHTIVENRQRLFCAQ